MKTMKTISQKLGDFVRWLREPPERPNARGTTMAIWLLIFGGFGYQLLNDSWQDAEARQSAKCVVRVALLDVYDFADELGASSEFTDGARARLDLVLPGTNCDR